MHIDRLLEACIKMPMPECRLFMYPKVYMVSRHDALSMVYDHLNQYEEAIVQAEIALESCKNDRIEKNVRIWRDWLAKNDG